MIASNDEIHDWHDRLESQMEGTIFDRAMVFDETLSTQDAAARACVGLPTDHQATMVVASRQLMGRGSRAQNWYDAFSCTLPTSIAIGPEYLKLSNANISARAGLATLDAIGRAAPDHRFAVKWPNDIHAMLDHNTQRKIAGVLIEYARDSIVIGIGINCTQAISDFHPEIQGSAVSLKQLGSNVSRIDLACMLIDSLHYWFAVASEDEVLAHWNTNDALVGQTRKFVHDNTPYTGKIIAINPLSAIRLETDQGVQVLPADQTRILKPSE